MVIIIKNNTSITTSRGVCDWSFSHMDTDVACALPVYVVTCIYVLNGHK